VTLAPPDMARALRVRWRREWRRVDSPWGLIVVNRFDQYLGWSFMAYGVYNLDEVRFLCDLLGPGDVVLDVGANIGALTVPMAQVPGITAVHAFEPQPRVRELLEENVHLTTPPDGPVVIHPYALGSAPGILHIPDIDYTALGNFGGVALGDTGTTEVEVRTLDSLRLQKVTLMKVDVEGAEAAVLRGARETIARCRPILYLENDRPEKEADLLALLDELGYDHEPHWPPLYSRENLFQNPTNMWPQMVSKNIICYPRAAP
jgi:FkbM family methyltransferase